MIARQVNEETKAQYRTHIQRYHRQTAHMSFDQVKHPDYQALIDMGSPIIPLLLEDLLAEHYQHEAFSLLSWLTGQCPISNQDSGKVPKMRLAWIKWGIENGYLEVVHPRPSFRQRLWERIWKREKVKKMQRSKILTNFFYVMIGEELLRSPNGEVWHGSEEEAKTKLDELRGDNGGRKEMD